MTPNFTFQIPEATQSTPLAIRLVRRSQWLAVGRERASSQLAIKPMSTSPQRLSASGERRMSTVSFPHPLSIASSSVTPETARGQRNESSIPAQQIYQAPHARLHLIKRPAPAAGVLQSTFLPAAAEYSQIDLAVVSEGYPLGYLGRKISVFSNLHSVGICKIVILNGLRLNSSF